ncbi:MAG: DUF2474 family protein [Novosphingobium sp.]
MERLKQLSWLVAIWAASVVAVLTVGQVIRIVLKP